MGLLVLDLSLLQRNQKSGMHLTPAVLLPSLPLNSSYTSAIFPLPSPCGGTFPSAGCAGLYVQIHFRAHLFPRRPPPSWAPHVPPSPFPSSSGRKGAKAPLPTSAGRALRAALPRHGARGTPLPPAPRRHPGIPLAPAGARTHPPRLPRRPPTCRPLRPRHDRRQRNCCWSRAEPSRAEPCPSFPCRAGVGPPPPHGGGRLSPLAPAAASAKNGASDGGSVRRAGRGRESRRVMCKGVPCVTCAPVTGISAAFLG
ncbi:neural Wiskott-Aldrich syndrome protein-like [Pipra filicauda]|uniref:Neural Wiskott-Aldrich syndrome protein-like n=1 Tax=Pipra filicauda TaxID=649802 RepID=A0A7R5KDY3_9PASS|nr:neural Wiskott-Aldrich syndrome protein-like [Pipra filicauda]XP_039235818.1 neural Wiskott-Aldrich syndrome protein-like [Pipra filicauda]